MQADELHQAMKPVTEESRTLIEGYFRRHPTDICVFAFPFMLFWSITRDHRFVEHDGHLLLSYKTPAGERRFYMPFGPDPIRIMKEMKPCDGYFWSFIDEKHVAALSEAYVLDWEKDYFDYVYELKDLRALEGEKYAEKRTFIRRCMKKNPAIVKLTSAHHDGCMRIHDAWVAKQQNPDMHSINEERQTLSTTLRRFEEYGFMGVGLEIDGVLEAFATAYPLNDAMMIEDFEKATDAAPGLYPTVLHELAKAIPEPFRTLNREADIGLPGLRIAKQRWNPSALVRRYFIDPSAQA